MKNSFWCLLITCVTISFFNLPAFSKTHVSVSESFERTLVKYAKRSINVKANKYLYELDPRLAVVASGLLEALIFNHEEDDIIQQYVLASTSYYQLFCLENYIQNSFESLPSESQKTILKSIRDNYNINQKDFYILSSIYLYYHQLKNQYIIPIPDIAEYIIYDNSSNDYDINIKKPLYELYTNIKILENSGINYKIPLHDYFVKDCLMKNIDSNYIYDTGYSLLFYNAIMYTAFRDTNLFIDDNKNIIESFEIVYGKTHGFFDEEEFIANQKEYYISILQNYSDNFRSAYHNRLSNNKAEEVLRVLFKQLEIIIQNEGRGHYSADLILEDIYKASAKIISSSTNTILLNYRVMLSGTYIAKEDTFSNEIRFSILDRFSLRLDFPYLLYQRFKTNNSEDNSFPVYLYVSGIIHTLTQQIMTKNERVDFQVGIGLEIGKWNLTYAILYDPTDLVIHNYRRSASIGYTIPLTEVLFNN